VGSRFVPSKAWGAKKGKGIKMKFRDQLEKLEACKDSLEWVGNKSLEQAWETCENSNWMLWVLSQMDLDLIDPICDMAERVLDLVPEEGKLACIWAISAAKRRASKDELSAASTAACYAVACIYASRSSTAVSNAAYYASRSAADAAYAAACYAAVRAASFDVADAAVDAAAANIASGTTVFNDAYSAAGDAYRKEKKEQCNILRKHFTIDQVKKAFNKLVA
jgi:hypothetical protein